MSRRAIAAVAAVVLIGGLGAAASLGAFDSVRGRPPAAASAAAPEPVILDTTFRHFDGRIVRLSDWSGTPMVVNFWASWCPPCVAEMSEAFEPVHQQLADQVAFVGLSMKDDPADAFVTVRQTGVTYDLGQDPVGELFRAFDGFGMPTTVFLDEAGAVVDTHTGALSRGELEQKVADAFGIHVP